MLPEFLHSQRFFRHITSWIWLGLDYMKVGKERPVVLVIKVFR